MTTHTITARCSACGAVEDIELVNHPTPGMLAARFGETPCGICLSGQIHLSLREGESKEARVRVTTLAPVFSRVVLL